MIIKIDYSKFNMKKLGGDNLPNKKEDYFISTDTLRPNSPDTIVKNSAIYRVCNIKDYSKMKCINEEGYYCKGNEIILIYDSKFFLSKDLVLYLEKNNLNIKKIKWNDAIELDLSNSDLADPFKEDPESILDKVIEDSGYMEKISRKRNKKKKEVTSKSLILEPHSVRTNMYKLLISDNIDDLIDELIARCTTELDTSTLKLAFLSSLIRQIEIVIDKNKDNVQLCNNYYKNINKIYKRKEKIINGKIGGLGKEK